MEHAHLSVALALVVAACATASAHPVNWDTNGDGHLDVDEYRACLEETGLFDVWDSNGGGSLSPDEFEAGLSAHGLRFRPAHDFETWDYDGNGRLGAAEFYGGSFRELDVDGNGVIDPFEFAILGQGLGLVGGVEIAEARIRHKS